MREVIGAIVGAILVSTVLTHEVAANENNEAIKGCLVTNGYTPEKFQTFDFRIAAACYQKYKSDRNAKELAELRDFLKHNPRYRYPGQSMNKCWGKPREMPFESAGIEMSDKGMKAWVNYKDKLPAGCFETAPWDNRDVKG